MHFIINRFTRTVSVTVTQISASIINYVNHFWGNSINSMIQKQLRIIKILTCINADPNPSGRSLFVCFSIPCIWNRKQFQLNISTVWKQHFKIFLQSFLNLFLRGKKLFFACLQVWNEEQPAFCKVLLYRHVKSHLEKTWLINHIRKHHRTCWKKNDLSKGFPIKDVYSNSFIRNSTTGVNWCFVVCVNMSGVDCSKLTTWRGLDDCLYWLNNKKK